MKYSVSVWVLSHFYHSAVKAELKRWGFPKSTARKIVKEHKAITIRA